MRKVGDAKGPEPINPSNEPKRKQQKTGKLEFYQEPAKVKSLKGRVEPQQSGPNLTKLFDRKVSS